MARLPGLYDRNYGFVSLLEWQRVIGTHLDKANGGFKALTEEYMPVH